MGALFLETALPGFCRLLPAHALAYAIEAICFGLRETGEVQYALNVAPGLRIGRNALVPRHRALAGIVGGGNQRPVIAIAALQPLEIGQAAAYIVVGIERLADTETPLRYQHELHHALRILRRNGSGIQV